MQMDAKLVGWQLGCRHAAEQIGIIGTTWAQGRLLRALARMAWDARGKRLAGGDNDEASFLLAYEAAYRSYGHMDGLQDC